MRRGRGGGEKSARRSARRSIRIFQRRPPVAQICGVQAKAEPLTAACTALRSRPAVTCSTIVQVLLALSDVMRRAPVLLLGLVLRELSPTSAAIVADVSGCAAVDQYKLHW